MTLDTQHIKYYDAKGKENSMEHRAHRMQANAEVVYPAADRGPQDPGSAHLPAPADALPAAQPAEEQPEQEVLGVYVISVTARILRMHPQTLRKYERLGLVHPSRSGGMVRYYSDQDLSRLRMIKYLVEERGMNLAGVELALEMVSRLQTMQRALMSQWETEAAAVLQSEMQSVLEMLHFAEQDFGASDEPAHG